MESDHDAPAVERHHFTQACDCPVHSQMGSLLAELSEAQAEVRRLRMSAPDGPALQLSDGRYPISPIGWRGLAHIRRSLWWALSDSE